MVPVRSKYTGINWLQAQITAFCKAVKIVAIHAFTGYKTAAEQLPDATTVTDPFHVAALAGTALDTCRQASNRPPWTGAAKPVTRSMGSAKRCAPSKTIWPTDSEPNSAERVVLHNSSVIDESVSRGTRLSHALHRT